MKTLIFFAIGIVLTCIVLALVACARAPKGHEEKDGFHLDK